MTVGELLSRITSEELTEWMAYEQVTGPLGAERDDILMAILAATIANTNRGKRGRRARPKDFLPTWDQARKVMPWQDMLAAVKRINAQLGGTDLTEGGTASDGDPGRAPRAPRHRRRRSQQRGQGSGQ